MRIIFSILVFLAITTTAYCLPSFPGAQGVGGEAVGGRGGTVYIVSNLNDSGTGSLREACEASGARYVVFSVSGIIRLSSPITITNDYITIAGQTSPGGICIEGYPFRIRCAEAIITHMRFRMGAEHFDTENDAANVWGAADGFPGSTCSPTHKNIIWDHCSFSWGNDETFTLTAVPQNVTVSWSIISEGLDDPQGTNYNHGFGLSVSGKFNQVCQSDNIKVTLHHNYIAHHRLRLPQITTPSDLTDYPTKVDARNNIIYNWMDHNVPFVSGGSHVNWVGNYSKAGPNSDAFGTCGYFAMLDGDGDGTQVFSETIYSTGNKLYGGTFTGWGWDDFDANGCSTISDSYQKSTAWDFGGIPVTTSAMDDIYAATMLADVGANKCQSGDCRDSVDTATVADFAAGTGAIIDDVTWPDDWPTYSTPVPPTDSDSDGMADTWEISEFGDLTRTANGDEDGDGYENIEEYMHSLAGYTVAATPSSKRRISIGKAVSIGGHRLQF